MDPSGMSTDSTIALSSSAILALIAGLESPSSDSPHMDLHMTTLPWFVRITYAISSTQFS
jgi:hypothetical protein